MSRLSLALGVLLLANSCLSDNTTSGQFLYPNGHVTFRQGDTVDVMWETSAAFIYLYLNGPDSSVDGQRLLASSPAPSYTWHIDNATANYYFALHAANSDGTPGIDEAHSPLFSVAAAVASIGPSTWNVNNSPTSTSTSTSANSPSTSSSTPSPSSGASSISTSSMKTSTTKATSSRSSSSTVPVSAASSTPMATSTLTGGSDNPSDTGSKSSGVWPVGKIVGVAAAAVIGVLALACLIWDCYRRHQKRRGGAFTVTG